MTTEHFEKIQKGMSDAFEKHPDCIARYASLGLSDVRLAWDLYHISLVDGMTSLNFTCKVLYDYLNDSHIQTALLKILSDLKKVASAASGIALDREATGPKEVGFPNAPSLL